MLPHMTQVDDCEHESNSVSFILLKKSPLISNRLDKEM